MYNLTNISDVDKLILLNLDDKSLSQAASTSSYINSLMNESFWASKFEQKYGVTLWKYGVSHRYIYREFSNLKGGELIRRVIGYEFIELLETLLEDNDIHKLLVLAARYGHLKVVELLLNNGAYIHTNDDTALQWAARKGHLKVVKLLLDKGANIHSNHDGALRLAAENGHLEVVELLVDKGADIHTDDDSALRSAANNGHLKVIELLLDKGIDIHANNDEALRLATRYRHLKVVQLLLDRGAIPDNNTTKLINKLDPTLL